MAAPKPPGHAKQWLPASGMRRWGMLQGVRNTRHSEMACVACLGRTKGISIIRAQSVLKA